jgi:hypothetical protein
MSDIPARGATAPLGETVPKTDPLPPPGVTAPLAAHAAHAPGGHHRATQMSPSAVPSTLESPKDPPPMDGAAQVALERRIDVALAAGTTAEEINGSTVRDDAARDAAIHDALKAADAQGAASGGAPSDEHSARRHGPATMMSPIPGPSGGSVPPPGGRSATDAVVDAVLPAAAFQPPPYAGGGNADAQWGPPGAHAGAFEARDRQAAPGGQLHGSMPAPALGAGGMPRRSNTMLIVLIAGGVVVLLIGLVIVGGGALFFSRRAAATRAAKAQGGSESSNAGSPAGAGAAGQASPGATGGGVQPRAVDPRAMGGTRARLIALSAGALEVEAVRAAITTVLPQVDACFVASELEPPNHESVTYELDVATSGTITRAEPTPQTGRAPKLDACVGGALRTARMPRGARNTRVKLTLSARIGELQQTR